MSQHKKWPHGMFAWIDLNSSDAEAAKSFYSKLFGWEVEDVQLPMGGVYTMFRIDGQDVAAVSQQMPEQQEQGYPSAWNSYIAVDDVDEVAARATELGGTTVMEPFDVMQEGRMAGIQDPTGAIVLLWQARNHVGARLFNQHGALSWNELATRDTETAERFYCELFNWTAEQDESGYTVFMNRNRSNGGMMQINENWGDVPPHWSVYLGVDDIDEAVKRVEEMGGTVHLPPFDMGGAGRGSMVSDPTGARFTLIELNNADPSPELT